MGKRVGIIDMDPQCNATMNFQPEIQKKKLSSEERKRFEAKSAAQAAKKEVWKQNAMAQGLTAIKADPMPDDLDPYPVYQFDQDKWLVVDGKPADNVFSVLDSAFTNFTNPLPDVELTPIEVDRFDHRLWLLPGSRRLNQLEAKLQGTVLDLKPWAHGCFRRLFEQLAHKYALDFLVTDLPPNTGILTQTVVLSSDSIIAPVHSEYFNTGCVHNMLCEDGVLHRWLQWREQHRAQVQKWLPKQSQHDQALFTSGGWYGFEGLPRLLPFLCQGYPLETALEAGSGGPSPVEHEHATFVKAITNIVETGSIPAEVEALYCPDANGAMAVPLLAKLRHHVLAQACGLSLFLLDKKELQGYLRDSEVEATIKDHQFIAEKKLADQAFESLCTFICSIPRRSQPAAGSATARQGTQRKRGDVAAGAGSTTGAKKSKAPRLIGGGRGL